MEEMVGFRIASRSRYSDYLPTEYPEHLMHRMHQSISTYLNSGGELDEGNVLGYRLEGFDQRGEVDLWRCVLVADDDNRFSLRTP